MRLDLLRNSCRRLPELIEADAPTNLLVSEIHILLNHAMKALEEAVSLDVGRGLEQWRARQKKSADTPTPPATERAVRQPKRVRMLQIVRSEIPGRPLLRANPGEEYWCKVNQHGAVSIPFFGGRLLGVKPDEFEVIEWTE